MEISFPDGSHKRIASDGAEDITFPDGTRVQVTIRITLRMRYHSSGDFSAAPI
jgi:hypothetical protein